MQISSRNAANELIDENLEIHELTFCMCEQSIGAKNLERSYVFSVLRKFRNDKVEEFDQCSAEEFD